ncbi:MAG: hypothetical protein ACI8U3_002631 [Brevundimonas sp.]|jgi:hypothetical protein
MMIATDLSLIVFSYLNATLNRWVQMKKIMKCPQK